MNPCGKSVRRFLPTTSVIGFGMFYNINSRRIKTYSWLDALGLTQGFRFGNGYWGNPHIHIYDCQGHTTVVKVWISILRKFSNPWNKNRGTMNIFLFLKFSLKMGNILFLGVVNP
jgi:hypothetical protein